MRLWHTELIPFIPKSQLLAQWRELNSIFVKEDKTCINQLYLRIPERGFIYLYTNHSGGNARPWHYDSYDR